MTMKSTYLYFCTRCKEEIKIGELYISTGNGKKYHHPQCSNGVPLLKAIYWETVKP